MFYPIYLNLKGKRVVVVGGGEVAERRVESMLGTGASIVVISPEVTAQIQLFADAGKIELHRRRYARSDCDSADLVFSAVDDAATSEAIFQDAQKAGALVNTADQAALCDFIMPAVLRRGDVAIAISTGGSSPGLAARLRRDLENIVGPEYGQLAAMLARARPIIRERFASQEQRKELHDRILNSDIMELLKRGDIAGAERLLKEIIES